MIKAVAIGLSACLALIALVAGAVDGVARVLFGDTSPPSKSALADIPETYLALYRTATTTCPGLDWTILAAIGKIESDHGRSTLPGVHSGANHAGAGGPMQFLQSTFDSVVARHPIPAGGSTPPTRYNPHDAIHAAAAYLCDSGARNHHDIRAAIWAYNHADWYVSQVLTQAEQYRSTEGLGGQTTADTAALRAINYAEAQLGLPYVWGGNGPHDGGFDCSGLTKAAYAAAGITLPRTAHTQFHAGPTVPANAQLLPGDLVFYGNPATKIHHVGLYIGSGQIINAPTFGQPVQIGPLRWPNDGYAGATRPTNQQLLR